TGPATLGELGQLVDGRLGQAQHLAQVPHRATQVVGGEAAHQRGVVVAVALVDLQNELLPNVAREVEVDVRDRLQLLIEEAVQEELVLYRIHVGEADEIAEDGADRGAAPAAGRQPGGAACSVF